MGIQHGLRSQPALGVRMGTPWKSLSARLGGELDRMGLARVEARRAGIRATGAPGGTEPNVGSVRRHLRRSTRECHIRPPLRVCRPGSDHRVCECTPQLDLYATAEPGDVCAAAALLRPLYWLQGTGSAPQL